MIRPPAAILATLLLCAALCPAQTTQPATQPTTRPSGVRSAVGMNTNGVSDWDTSQPFIDLVKSARPFGSPTSPSAYDLPDSPTYDEWGWPQGDFGSYLVTGRKPWPGVYKVICGGKVDSIRLSASTGTVGPVAYDAARNVTTAEVTIPDNGNQIALRFIGTQRNPANVAEGKGVRYVQVLAPGYEAPATPETGVFTREYLKAWQPFGHARLMALTATNSHPVATWAERAKVPEARWSSDRGVPWEVQADLCVRTGVAPWVCVPAAADDEYVIALATLWRDALGERGPPVYVEDSNEVWNATLGTQYGHNKQAAESEVASGDPNGYTLPVTSWNPKTGKDETQNAPGRDLWLWFRHARRTLHVTKIFQDVFGPGQAYRVRGVLGLQNSDDWRSSVTLGYIARQYGPPADLLYGVAIAPYYGNSGTLIKDSNATAAQLAQWARDTGASALIQPDSKPDRHRKLADHWGLKLLAYEGGLDWDQNSIALPAKAAAMKDPLTGEGEAAYLNNAFGPAGFAAFTPWLAGRQGRWGFYASTNDIRDLQTPRMLADVAAAQRFMLADPVKPDPRDALIRQLQADLAASQAAAASAAAERDRRANQVDRAKAVLSE